MIGNQLRSLRRSKKLTQVELSKVLEVSAGAIALWETNKREPDSDMLKKIANFFNVSLDFLLCESIDNSITILGRNGEYKKFELTDDELKSIKNLAESLQNKKK